MSVGSETIVCYLSKEDCGTAEDAEYMACCAAQLGDHAAPIKRLVKFTLGELWDPAGQIGPGRLKEISWGLSQYSGRLVIMAHGYGSGHPFDLGAQAGRIESSVQMAEVCCRFLGHLATARPTMPLTTRIDLVVCRTGCDFEDDAKQHTIAEAFLASAHKQSQVLFAQSLTTTAPKGYFVYTGKLAVAPGPDGRGKVGVFKAGGKSMLEFVTHKWRTTDLNPKTMLVSSSRL